MEANEVDGFGDDRIDIACFPLAGKRPRNSSEASDNLRDSRDLALEKA